MITIKGSLTIQDKNGQQHTIAADDFVEDEHLDGSTTSTFSHDTGSLSIERTVENKDGVINSGDWESENCSIVKDDISFQ